MWTESHQGNSLRCFHCAKCACCTSHPISRPLHCEMFRHSRFKATTKVGIWCDMTNKQSDRVNTSSTAQGGGGSFENRKTIGEVGCCESGIAERCHWWIERCLISLTLSLPFSDYLPTYLSIFHVSIYLSISLSLSLSLSFDYPIYLSIYLSLSLFLSSVYLSSCLAIYLSIYLSLSLFHRSICLAV